MKGGGVVWRGGVVECGEVGGGEVGGGEAGSGLVARGRDDDCTVAVDVDCTVDFPAKPSDSDSKSRSVVVNSKSAPLEPPLGSHWKLGRERRAAKINELDNTLLVN